MTITHLPKFEMGIIDTTLDCGRPSGNSHDRRKARRRASLNMTVTFHNTLNEMRRSSVCSEAARLYMELAKVE